MAKSTLKTNLTKLYQKYNNLQSDFKLYRQAIIQQALQAQYKRNNESKTLCKILEISYKFFPYITDKEEMRVIQDRISDHFQNNKLKDPIYEKWYAKLPNLFRGANRTNRNLQAIFNLDSDGIPDSMSVQHVEPTDDTYTITVRKDSTGDIVFSLGNISQSITMTSLSEITKAMS